jgi:hypothetical protein
MQMSRAVLTHKQGRHLPRAPKFNNVLEKTLKGPQKEKFYVVNVLDKTYPIPKRIKCKIVKF